MKTKITIIWIFTIIFLGATTFGQTQVKQNIDPAAAKLGKGFTSKTAQVNRTTLHYVRGEPAQPSF